ncbi:hypothetical protein [Nocardioides sp. InS609-2]|uniref:hypothetical protein n=1 Tax=Nocardioides sp. InS609-2 TaxID=2760705 RepID=UPI0020BF5506|nr:hypothetical protein [Nocardioides sp. InS609-2]
MAAPADTVSPWRLDEYGAAYDDHIVQLSSNLVKGLSESEREQIQPEVLASIVWR